MRRVFIMFVWVCVLILQGYAQRTVYDPLNDPDVVIRTSPPKTTWSSAYMWYPGQLAAYLQQQCRDISKHRCANVGYPGQFFAKHNRAFFRKNVLLKERTSLEWVGADSITLFVNGEKKTGTINSCLLDAGRNSLMFEVNSLESLPCVMLKGIDELTKEDGWEVSLDKINWVLPESDLKCNNPAVLPDKMKEWTAVLKPFKVFPLCNSAQKANRIELGKNGIVLVDFYHLEIGTLVFHVEGKGKVTVRVGETPEEALNRNELFFEQYPITPYCITANDTLIRVPERAFRYVSLECSDSATISNLEFEASIYPVKYQMQFDSDSEYVNNLFNMGAATLHTSMHRFYLDGVKRDFLPWAMDAIVSTLGGDYLFGDKQISKNGISVALLPLNPQKKDLGITDYPLHALVGLRQNYLYYGDIKTLLQYKNRIEQLLLFYESIVDKDGFLHGNVSPTGFIPGWATKNGPNGKGIASYAQILLYYNYQIAADFYDLWKEKKQARKYRDKAVSLKKNIMNCFWSKEKKAFINGMDVYGKKDERLSLHAQYWAVLSGLFPREHYDNLFERVLPNIPYYFQDISYEKGYELLAYAKAGRVKEMWNVIDRVFGDWMKQGHTRFPENFSPKASKEEQLRFYGRPFGLSLCHGANGVPPIVGVLNGILGFSQPQEFGGDYIIRPELLELRWVNAKIPVKEGVIELKLKADGESEICLPAKCRIELVTQKGKKVQLLKKEGKHVFKL